VLLQELDIGLDIQALTLFTVKGLKYFLKSQSFLLTKIFAVLRQISTSRNSLNSLDSFERINEAAQLAANPSLCVKFLVSLRQSQNVSVTFVVTGLTSPPGGEKAKH
jgi:hypothetical protein